MCLNFNYCPFLPFVSKESDTSRMWVGFAYFLRIFKTIEKFMGSKLFFSEKGLGGVLNFLEEVSGLLLKIEGLFKFLPFLSDFD